MTGPSTTKAASGAGPSLAADSTPSGTRHYHRMKWLKRLLLTLTPPAAIIGGGTLWGPFTGWDLTQPQATIIAAFIAVSGAVIAYVGVSTQLRGQASITRAQHTRELAYQEVTAIQLILGRFLTRKTAMASMVALDALDQLNWETIANELELKAVSLDLLGLEPGAKSLSNFASELRRCRRKAADSQTRERVAKNAREVIADLKTNLSQI